MVLSESRKINDKPTPLDFETFVPWVCMQWQCPKSVAILRAVQEDYVKQVKRSSLTKTKSARSVRSKHDDYDGGTRKSVTSKTSYGTTHTEAPTRSSDMENTVQIKASYDTRGHLVEISMDRATEIPRKVFQALSLCIPFHSMLTKFSIRRGGVTSYLLYELSKFLPLSNITEICLDDCYVSEGNFYILLEDTTQLKCLSLNRCRINDLACKDLAMRLALGAAGSSLLSLELGSNFITDDGARFLSHSLRSNRSLLHLNLSGNSLTDSGAKSILKLLMEFPLTCDEILQSRDRKMKYLENKFAVYEKCYQEATERQKMDLEGGSSKKSLRNKPQKRIRKSTSVFVSERSVSEVAENMTMEIVGNFSDPFEYDSLVRKDGFPYSIGNTILSSLNFSYNNLAYPSIKLIHDVLKYQRGLLRPGITGLVRLVFEGNYIPAHCVEYEDIQKYLLQSVNAQAPIETPTHARKKTSSIAPSKH